MSLNIKYLGGALSFDVDRATPSECLNYLRNCKEVSIDIETTGLDPHSSNIVMFQIGDINTQFVIDSRYYNIKFLEPILSNNEIVKIGQNLKFEYKFILKHLGVRIESLYDTMIVENIIYKGYELSNSLESLIERYLDIEVDKTIRLDFLTIGNREFTETHIKYGAEDVLFPIKIKELQQKRILEYDFQKVIELELEFIPVLGDIELKGLYLDPIKWMDLYEVNKSKTIDAKNKLEDFIVENNVDRFIDKQLDMFSDEQKTIINWDSPIQVIDLFRHLNICPKEDNSYTVNSNTLKRSLNDSNKDKEDYLINFIKDYLKYKEFAKMISTYGEKFLNNINPITGRIHSSYNQIMNTGRIASRSPNLQNIPSDSSFRECFTSSSDTVLVGADYSGQENILLANVSLDENILSFYESGETDMHSFNAKMTFNDVLKDYTLQEVKDKRPDLREIAKTVGFALAYGGDGNTIANNLGLSTKEGMEIYDAYFGAFPTLKKFFDKAIKDSLDRGYIIIDYITNRKYFFKDFKILNTREGFRIRGSYERKSLNYIIQGAAGSVTKLAAVLFRKYILRNNLQDKVFLVNLIHDEITVEAPISLGEEVGKNLIECMERAGSYWCKTIELKADYVVSDSWKS